MSEGVTLFVSIDTEEDNWRPARDGVTVGNIRHLPRLASFLDGLGVRATYFVTHAVACDGGSATVLREIRSTGRAAIGAHLHPWNTPPMPEPLDPRLTMVKNVPFDLQLAKIESLTTAIHDAVGTRPTAFRAGRNGLGRETVTALLRCGYRVDASVTPTVDWRGHDDGPDFMDAPIQCHRWPNDGDADDLGEGLLEVPNSFGFSRRPFRIWGQVHRVLGGDASRRGRLLAVANRLGILRRIVLSPELSSTRDMLLLSRRLMDEGVRHLQMFLHTPTFQAGLTPHAPTEAHVERIYGAVESYVERLCAMTAVRFATMNDAVALLDEAVPARTGSRSGEATP